MKDLVDNSIVTEPSSDPKYQKARIFALIGIVCCLIGGITCILSGRVFPNSMQLVAIPIYFSGTFIIISSLVGLAHRLTGGILTLISWVPSVYYGIYSLIYYGGILFIMSSVLTVLGAILLIVSKALHRGKIRISSKGI